MLLKKCYTCADARKNSVIIHVHVHVCEMWTNWTTNSRKISLWQKLMLIDKLFANHPGKQFKYLIQKQGGIH